MPAFAAPPPAIAESAVAGGAPHRAGRAYGGGMPFFGRTAQTGRTVRIDAGALTYRLHVSARASAEPPVVLVHGIGMSHRYFARLRARLAPERTVVSVDLPGHGGVPKPGMDAGIPAIAEGLGAALDAIDLGRAVVVGHSMGAQWATELAVQRPDLVAAVVLVGPVADDRNRTLPRQALALAVDSARETPLANTIVFTDYLRCGIRWYLAQARHMVAYPLEERVGMLRAPVLVLRGGRDPIAGARWCRRLRDAARDGRAILVPQHPHVVQHSAPAAVASAVRAFCATL
jgi:pimeloyl-ACP methyl ester carboxylesterase